MIRIEVISPGAFDSEHTSYKSKNGELLVVLTQKQKAKVIFE
jgi:hypothetical protein